MPGVEEDLRLNVALWYDYPAPQRMFGAWFFDQLFKPATALFNNIWK
jgi:hypothetical protein